MIGKLLRKTLYSQPNVAEKTNSRGFDIAVVDRRFDPVLGGRVRYKGSIWPAFTDEEVFFEEKEVVRVLGIEGISLQVKKYC